MSIGTGTPKLTRAVRSALRRDMLQRVSAGVLVASTAVATVVHAQPGPPELELSFLQPENGGDGSAGVVLNGPVSTFRRSGHPVSQAGDVNGDGIDDFVISDGASTTSGQHYVVFGTTAGFPAAIELSSLYEANGGNGAAGFVLHGARTPTAAGDMNGDGIGDLLVGAGSSFKSSYVVFGTDQGFDAEIELTSLQAINGGDGSQGFIVKTSDTSYERFGSSVSAAGDVDGDGFADIILGAERAAPGGRFLAGASFVVFGTDAAVPAEFDVSLLLEANGGDGTQGFVINGIDSGDEPARNIRSSTAPVTGRTIAVPVSARKSLIGCRSRRSGRTLLPRLTV